MENQAKFVCENCSTEYDNDHELISLNGVGFCGKCTDDFHFLKDEHLGFIALKQVDRATFDELPTEQFVDTSLKL